MQHWPKPSSPSGLRGCRRAARGEPPTHAPLGWARLSGALGAVGIKHLEADDIAAEKRPGSGKDRTSVPGSVPGRLYAPPQHQTSAEPAAMCVVDARRGTGRGETGSVRTGLSPRDLHLGCALDGDLHSGTGSHRVAGRSFEIMSITQACAQSPRGKSGWLPEAALVR